MCLFVFFLLYTCVYLGLQCEDRRMVWASHSFCVSGKIHVFSMYFFVFSCSDYSNFIKYFPSLPTNYNSSSLYLIFSSSSPLISYFISSIYTALFYFSHLILFSAYSFRLCLSFLLSFSLTHSLPPSLTHSVTLLLFLSLALPYLDWISFSLIHSFSLFSTLSLPLFPPFFQCIQAFLWWITPQRLVYYFLLRIVRRCFVPFMRLGLVIIIKKTVIGKFICVCVSVCVCACVYINICVCVCI